jgi:hypothetical protein
VPETPEQFHRTGRLPIGQNQSNSVLPNGTTCHAEMLFFAAPRVELREV